MNYILYDGEVMYVPNMARAFDKLSMDVFSISEMPPHFFAIFLRSCWWWWIIWSFSWLLAILILFKMENFKFVLSTSILHRHKMMLFRTRNKITYHLYKHCVPLRSGIFFLSFVFGLHGSLSLAFRLFSLSVCYISSSFFGIFYHVDFMTLTW